MTTKKENCPMMGRCDQDIISRGLGKVGICRSMLVTLALLPFAWDGVLWAADVVRFLWDAATTAVS